MMNKRKVCFFILVIFGILFVPKFAMSQSLSAMDIVKKANLAAYYAGDNGLSDVKMVITDSQGRERIRKFRILRIDIEDGGAQKFYTYFQEPQDVAKMVYLVWKYKDKDDDRWLYMPALDLVRRIASSDKRTSFVGSHFLYEDITGRAIDEDVHELISIDGDTYQLKSTPKKPEEVEFSYVDIWINKETFLPEKFNYYDKKGKLMRTIEALEESVIQGHPTVTKQIAKDLVRGGETVVEFKTIEYDIGLDESIFAERYLRRPPVKWIK